MSNSSASIAVHGPTLTLRLPVREDADALLELAGDPEVTRWFSWGPYTSIDQPLYYIDGLESWRDSGEQLDFLIVHREHGPAGIAHLAFEVLGMHRLGSYSNPANVRSTKALLGVGFTQEGVLRHWHRHGDEYYDVNVFGMLRSDWEAGPLASVPVAVEGPVPEAFVAAAAR